MTQQQAISFNNLYGFWPPGFGPDAIPPFTPAYEAGHTVTSENGTIATLNPWYFSDQPTADELMRRFSADHVANVPYLGGGGPNKTDNAKERWLVWRDGIAVNAGLLASNFTRNPENFFPHVAENACWAQINGARVSGQKLPVSM